MKSSSIFCLSRQHLREDPDKCTKLEILPKDLGLTTLSLTFRSSIYTDYLVAIGSRMCMRITRSVQSVELRWLVPHWHVNVWVGT